MHKLIIGTIVMSLFGAAAAILVRLTLMLLGMADDDEMS